MKIPLTLLMLCFTPFVFAQSNNVIPNISKSMIHHSQNNTAAKDTVIEKDTAKENKEPRYYYLGVSTNVFVNATVR